ncbi:MAG: asparagine synthetase B [Gemmatimonadetes bacterium]|nr:asparagine synthetase B [Gemmatimonadota bacterium]
MCGLAACSGPGGTELLAGMLERMAHRGPDGRGRLRVGASELGHVRLAIVDVAGGAQPMTNERGELAVVMNGEIYNHLALRAGLEERHQFRTRSDTEVVLHLYEEQAEDMLPRLDGMFAMALAGPRGLLLARDPLGIKPLYYGRRGDILLAASELKAFPEMDELHMLPAGHARHGESPPWRFAAPFPVPRPLVDAPLDEVLTEVRRRLEEAVKKRLMSDVPVGVFLSGGVDSSLIAACMRPHMVRLHTFTAGMAGAPDLAAARDVAHFLGTEHHELIYDEQDVIEAIPEVIRALESFDAPLVRSAVPMYFLARLASRYVKVVLTGEGADELFAGYDYLATLGGGEGLRAELVAITLRLQDTNLQRGDRMTMVHGLEGRVPFLDQALVRYVSRLPAELIEPRPDRPGKWLLREACRGLLPAELLERRKLKFSEGAGSAEVVSRHARRLVSRAEFDEERMAAGDHPLRSREELYYFRIWREAFGARVPPALVGRTLDRTAAVEGR